MDIKSKTHMCYETKDRVIEMHFDPEATLGELHDALVAWKNFVLDKMLEIQQRDKENQENLKDKPEEEQVKEEENDG